MKILENKLEITTREMNEDLEVSINRSPWNLKKQAEPSELLIQSLVY